MAITTKTKTIYICANCGATSPKWSGKCAECGEWNTFSEEIVSKSVKKKLINRSGLKKTISLGEINSKGTPKISTTIGELDRVLGGGLVAGSIVLLAGDPGIGKSTLMLQMAAAVSDNLKGEIIYCAGEESGSQIKMRADRLGLDPSGINLLLESNMDIVTEMLYATKDGLVIVDSIQTAFTENLESFAGSVSQVRETAGMLLKLAKSSGNIVFIVGHITKEGSIAGPKMLEHTVDTVLYMEGEKLNSYRILRSIKNRYGSTNEIGVFEMREKGLIEVENPSGFFLSGREELVPGSVVVASMEGTRPFLLEIQALVSSASYGTPQRNSTGIDNRRLAMIIAVLEKRAGLRLGMSNVFVNAAGGMKISETSVDLGTAVAMASSFKDSPVDDGIVVIGEIGLGGEVRPVSYLDRRLKEAFNLGFKHAVIPKTNDKNLKIPSGMRITKVASLSETLSVLL